MAKRFTDTNKYKKPFIRGLQGAYKVLWDYLYHDCDHAGIWIVDFEIAQIYVGSDLLINKPDALKFFNESKKRIIEIDNGAKWFIPSFIKFQYGELKESNRAHNSVINILKNKSLISSLQGAKDKDMVKELDKDKDKDKEQKDIPELFDFLEYARTVKIYHSSFDFQIETKYKTWVQNGWKDGNNKKIKNWKLKLNSTMPYFKKDISNYNGFKFPEQWKIKQMSVTEYQDMKKEARENGWKITQIQATGQTSFEKDGKQIII